MSVLGSWLASPPPDAAVEITPDRVSAAVVTVRGGTPVVQAYAAEPLPPGALVAAMTGQNVVDVPAVAGALRRVVERIGRPARVGLVVPDTVARVSLVRFDQLPGRRDDLDQLVRWQVKKAAPFPIDDAVVTYTPAARTADGGTELIVVAARRDVIQEYEGVCDAAGLYAGLVDLCTLNVMNLFLTSAAVPAGDWMLVHMRPEYTSLVVLRGAEVMFFRNRPESEDATLADLVHQTAMYYEDRLAGAGFSRVLLGGSTRTPGALEEARQSLEERLGVAVEPIDPTRLATLANRISMNAELADMLTPLLGMMLRAREEAAA